MVYVHRLRRKISEERSAFFNVLQGVRGQSVCLLWKALEFSDVLLHCSIYKPTGAKMSIFTKINTISLTS